MNTEITDTRNDKRNGRVFYDSACALCRRWAARFRPLLARNGYALVPLQSAEARRALKAAEPERLAEMRVITPDGDVLGGADAILHLAKAVRWGWPLFALGCLPGMKSLFRAAYRHVARNRHCDSGTCRARPAAASVPDWTAWSPLALATALALGFGRRLAPWAFMWLLAFAMFAGCKWLTFRTGAASRRTDRVRAAGYLFAWPGMDAETFLSKKPTAGKPPMLEWWLALGKMLFGSILVWALARRFAGEPLLAGWTGMVGLMFVLHFGLFHLLSLAWRLAGVNAPPMMRAPVLSKSPAEFWGARWNTGFHHLSNAFLFRPLHRRVGVGAAVLIVFFISGLIHDLVITVPARGGYGLPTLYFVVQGAGVLFARSRLARRGGVGRGGRGWLFTLALTAGPAFWLFPPPFVLNVMIPFLKTIGAL